MLMYVQEVDSMNQAVASHEGCHVYGWLDVKRVAANFHISVHVEDYMLLAQVSLGERAIFGPPLPFLMIPASQLYCNF